MFALGIVLAVLVYILVSFGVIVLARKIMPTRGARNWASVVVTLVAVLLPTGDHIIGYWVFKRECSKIGDGVEILRTVDNVEGFLDTSGIWGEGALLHGYTYVERQKRDLSVVTFESHGGDAVQEISISNPKSTYRYSTRLGEELYPGIRLTSQKIDNRVTGEVLASVSALSYGGGWVARSLGGGSYGRCGTDMNLTDFVVGVLRPRHTFDK